MLIFPEELVRGSVFKNFCQISRVGQRHSSDHGFMRCPTMLPQRLKSLMSRLRIYTLLCGRNAGRPLKKGSFRSRYTVGKIMVFSSRKK